MKGSGGNELKLGCDAMKEAASSGDSYKSAGGGASGLDAEGS